MESKNDYGLLVAPNKEYLRRQFKEMTKLLGVRCPYYVPKKGKNFDIHGELEANYYAKEPTWCIFDEYKKQQTSKKKGWMAELQEGSSAISVPYDLEGLEVGCLFEVPSALDGAPPRRFRVIKMLTRMIYPASITCEIALEYETTEEMNEIVDFKDQNFTLLKDNPEDD